MRNPSEIAATPLFSKNLFVLGCAVAGKAILSFALFFFTQSILHIEIASSCALLFALGTLAKFGVLHVGPSEIGDDPDGQPSVKEVLAVLRAIAIPLAGLLLCQCTQGAGWSAQLFGRFSVVLQTQESFAFVQCGSLMCATYLLLARKRVRNIMSFRYFSVLASLLLLVVPWTFADLSGQAKVFITALPWGFSSSFLLTITLVDLASMREAAFLPTSLLIVVLHVGAIAVSGCGLLLLGDDAVNVIWRILLILLIALNAVEILGEYQALEKELGKNSLHYAEKRFDGYKLTSREKEVLAFLVQGRRAVWIAQKLYISDNTVRSHTKHIYQKLGIHTREELLDLAEKDSGL